MMTMVLRALTMTPGMNSIPRVKIQVAKLFSSLALGLTETSVMQVSRSAPIDARGLSNDLDEW
jgi:hypothetical protein